MDEGDARAGRARAAPDQVQAARAGLVRLRREVDRGHVLVAVAELDAALEGRLHGARHSYVHSGAVGRLQHERGVLRGELELEARLELPLEHRVALEVEVRRVYLRALHRGEKIAWIEVEALRERDRLGGAFGDREQPEVRDHLQLAPVGDGP